MSALAARAGRVAAAKLRAFWQEFRAMSSKIWKRVGGWFPRHYVGLVFGSVLLVCVVALSLGVWRVPFVVADLLGQLEHSTSDPAATRGIVIALAAVLATITIFGTLIAQAIRVWTNERQTSTIEQGHVTDRLTRAVEQLGAEKQVKRIVRRANGREVRDKHKVPVVVETTEPNLEVRLGAIYALERIAQDSARDHITIMEILCAYIRENAKAEDAAQIPRAPRVDIQAAATVIGRRREDRIRAEQAASFRLDLGGTCLRGADLGGAQLGGSNLMGARLEGAVLMGARLERADLTEARLEVANLIEARLDRADLSGAWLEEADLSGADLSGANLSRTRLKEADLSEARLEGVILLEEQLEGVNLSGAWLEGAILMRGNLKSAE